MILLLGQRSRHAAHPELHARAHIGGDLAPDHDVGDGEPAARLEHAERLGDDLVLVGREIDDAVGDDRRPPSCRAAESPRSRPSGTRRSRPRPCAGCRGPARASRRSCPGRTPCPVGPTRRADSNTSMPPPDPRSRTISPSCSSVSAVGLPQPSDASTASAGSDRSLGLGIEIRADGVLRAAAAAGGATRGLLSRCDPQCRLAIPLANGRFHVFGSHLTLLIKFC